MIIRGIISNSNLVMPGTAKALLMFGLFMILLGLSILVFSRVLIVIMSALCFFAAFLLLRGAAKAWADERRQARTQRDDIIEIV